MSANSYETPALRLGEGLLEAQSPAERFEEYLPYAYLSAYCFGTSLFTPAACLYNLTKLNPAMRAQLTPVSAMRLATRILPHQTVLKALQIGASTPVKENLSPWAAFSLVGVLQGGLYGHANIFFLKTLKSNKVVSYAGVLRGYGFAGARDAISQGVPFMFSSTVEKKYFSPMFDKLSDDKNSVLLSVQKWSAVISTSICATYLSQGFHNCQTIMQSEQSLSHFQGARAAWKNNGFSLFYKGAEARVGLMLVINILNDTLLKKAWASRE